MPITPLHTLSILWISLKYPHTVDPLTIIISSVIIDIESVAGIILQKPHGFWHSYLGAMLVALLLAVIISMVERRKERLLNRIFKTFKLPFFPQYGVRKIIVAAFLGSISHVLLDSFTHRNFVNIFFPFEISSNPFWLGFGFAWIVYGGTMVLSVYSILRWYIISKRKSQIQETF